MSSRRTVFIYAVLIIAMGSAKGVDYKPTLKSLGDGLICQCSCTQTLNACNHYECASRAEMNDLAQKEIKAGKGETTILQDFVLHYGVKVLASPPATGFNRTVWILPGVGLVVGLGVVMAVVLRWRRLARTSRNTQPATVDPKLLTAVEEEMKTSGLSTRD